MFCPFCGEEVYLIERIVSVDDIICDSCEKTFSIKDNGQATEEEISGAQRKFQRQYESNRKSMFEKSESIVNRVISENVDTGLVNTEMKDPEWDRNVEGPGKIVYRS